MLWKGHNPEVNKKPFWKGFKAIHLHPLPHWISSKTFPTTLYRKLLKKREKKQLNNDDFYHYRFNLNFSLGFGPSHPRNFLDPGRLPSTGRGWSVVLWGIKAVFIDVESQKTLLCGKNGGIAWRQKWRGLQNSLCNRSWQDYRKCDFHFDKL